LFLYKVFLLTNNYIREILPYNKIIYGGSVNEENIDNIKSPEIDGYLLGGLSLKPKQLQTFIDKL
jgi:triosephosphate isomerase